MQPYLELDKCKPRSHTFLCMFWQCWKPENIGSQWKVLFGCPTLFNLSRVGKSAIKSHKVKRSVNSTLASFCGNSLPRLILIYRVFQNLWFSCNEQSLFIYYKANYVVTMFKQFASHCINIFYCISFTGFLWHPAENVWY